MRSFVVMCVFAAVAFANADSLRSLTTSLPQCQLCYPGTDGPCQQANSVCWHKDTYTHECPTGTSLCKCASCKSGSGPCMDCDGRCHNYINEDFAVCPLFTRRCTDHLPTCTACVNGSKGPCQQTNNGVCWAFLQAGDYDCPVGSQLCSCPRCKSGSGQCIKPDGSCTNKAEKDCKSPNWYCAGLPSFIPA